MLDIYRFCTPNGVAQEAPIVKHTFQSERVVLGGAANVAQQISNLVKHIDCKVDIHASSYNQMCHKTRYISDNTEVCRVDRDVIGPEITQQEINEFCKGADVLVISDYEKGTFSSSIQHSYPTIPTFIDCKNPTKFKVSKGIFFPNQKEFDANQAFGLNKCLVTKGHEGAALYTPTTGFSNFFLPPNPQIRPASVVGAGDVVVAAYTVASTLGFPPLSCAEIAVTCASVAVTHLIPKIKLDDLAKAWYANKTSTNGMSGYIRDFIVALGFKLYD
jgi:bifunctional ADP-heptose synthase (sugar kinase/adenylyltransferase)